MRSEQIQVIDLFISMLSSVMPINPFPRVIKGTVFTFKTSIIDGNDLTGKVISLVTMQVPRLPSFLQKLARPSNSHVTLGSGSLIVEITVLVPELIRKLPSIFKRTVLSGIIPFLVQRHAFQGVAKCYG